MERKKTTYWPLGILLIIVFGVMLLVAIVYVSTIQPLSYSDFYGKKNYVDKNINDLLSNVHEFERYYTPYVGDSLITTTNRVYTPYIGMSMESKPNVRYAISYMSESDDPKNVFLVLRGSQQSFLYPSISITGVELSLSRLDMKDKVLLVMEPCSLQVLDSRAVCYHSELVFEKLGRYDLIFRVRYFLSGSGSIKNAIYQSSLFVS